MWLNSLLWLRGTDCDVKAPEEDIRQPLPVLIDLLENEEMQLQQRRNRLEKWADLFLEKAGNIGDTFNAMGPCLPRER